MLRLAALTAGSGVGSEPFRGRVHSVFDRACTLERDDGRLLFLVAREQGAVPQGFQLATPPGFRFRDYLRGGETAAARGGILRLADAALVIDLRAARPWRGTARTARCKRGPAATAGAWSGAWRMLRAHGSCGLPRAAQMPIKGLCQASRSRQPRPARAAVAALIGLGPGLTPAGDDFLVGFITALRRSVGSDRARAVFVADLAAAIERAAASTNAISRAYLEAAAAGAVTQTLDRLAAALAERSPSRAAAAAVAAMAVGASSGAAATFGLLLAAAVWRDDILPWPPHMNVITPPSASGGASGIAAAGRGSAGSLEER